jgi:hypothetical protein
LHIELLYFEICSIRENKKGTYWNTKREDIPNMFLVESSYIRHELVFRSLSSSVKQSEKSNGWTTELHKQY